MLLPDYFVALARYHTWATQRLLDEYLPTLSDDEWRRGCGLFFGSVHGTVNHLLVADDIWWARFTEGRSMQMALDTELHAEREPLVGAVNAAVRRWTRWLQGIDATRFNGELSYTRTDGEAVTMPFAPTLGHVFNHATHHRGQISAALTAMGRSGPELDWAHLLRQESGSR